MKKTGDSALDFDASGPFPVVIRQNRSENEQPQFLNTLCVELTPTLSPLLLFHSQNIGIEAQFKEIQGQNAIT
jgi:hypothetical protein